MKARIIKKNIEEKVTDWLASLPMEVAEQVASKVVVTGGSIASMFLREPVNDYDIYFKDVKSAILISQHYCKKWGEDNKEGKTKGGIKPLKPMLRLSFTEEKYLEKYSYLGYIQPSLGKLVVDPNKEELTSFLESKLDWGKCNRVEIFIQSSGFLGNNPDEEYSYFEGEPSGSAEDYIEASLRNEEDILGQHKDKYSTVFMSSNAITLTDKMQLIIRFFGEPSEIHDTYDFIHATNYWTKKEGLVTNVKALEALLSKELIYAGSKYPLASIFRTRKFIKREWSCHVGNYIKMALQLNEMNLNDPLVLEEQLTGVDAAYMYEILKAVKNKQKEDPSFEFNSAYICELVDRMMGISGMDRDDIVDEEII